MASSFSGGLVLAAAIGRGRVLVFATFVLRHLDEFLMQSPHHHLPRRRLLPLLAVLEIRRSGFPAKFDLAEPVEHEFIVMKSAPVKRSAVESDARIPPRSSSSSSSSSSSGSSSWSRSSTKFYCSPCSAATYSTRGWFLFMYKYAMVAAAVQGLTLSVATHTGTPSQNPQIVRLPSNPMIRGAELQSSSPVLAPCFRWKLIGRQRRSSSSQGGFLQQ